MSLWLASLGLVRSGGSREPSCQRASPTSGRPAATGADTRRVAAGAALKPRLVQRASSRAAASAVNTTRPAGDATAGIIDPLRDPLGGPRIRSLTSSVTPHNNLLRMRGGSSTGHRRPQRATTARRIRLRHAPPTSPPLPGAATSRASTFFCGRGHSRELAYRARRSADRSGSSLTPGRNEQAKQSSKAKNLKNKSPPARGRTGSPLKSLCFRRWFQSSLCPTYPDVTCKRKREEEKGKQSSLSDLLLLVQKLDRPCIAAEGAGAPHV
jgi:hypothetical protein